MAQHDQQNVLAWYDASKPRFIDLVGDYAGKELFLVEGDSLLRLCFSDERLDFSGGFQMLHAVFLVESFLENLIKRHCQFNIAFFQEHHELCIPPDVPTSHRSRYLLARSVMIRHLFNHLADVSTVEVRVFPSLKSDVFDKYLVETPVHFVMCHDGKVLGKREDNEVELRSMVLLRSNILWFNTQSRNFLNVALINRIEFRDSKVFTMILEGRHDAEIVGRFEEEVEGTWDELNAEDSQKNIAPLTDMEHWLSKPVMKTHLTAEDGEIPESWYLTTCSISIMLSRGTDILFASAFIFHSLLLEHLSLSQRRLPLVSFEESFDESLEKFLETFAATANGVLDSKEWVDAMEKNDITSDLVDIVDGRLFRTVVSGLLDGSLDKDIPEAIKKDWLLVSEVVNSMTDKTLSLQSNTDTEISRTVEEFLEVDSDDDLSVMPFSNPIFDKHLECIHVTADASLVPRFGSMKIYRETSHWHNHKKPLNPKYAAPEKVSKWKNPLRTNQFYMAEMTSYAASLTGAKGKALEPETITVGVKKLSKPEDEKPSKPSKPAKPGKPAPKEEPAAANKKGTKKAAAGLTKAQQIIADNKEKKGGAETDKAFSAWIGVMKNLDELAGDQERYLRAKSYLDGLDSARASHVEGDINAYLLQSLLSWWGKYCKADKKPEGYHVVALIWTVVRSVSTSKAASSKEITQHVEKICKLVGISDAMSGANAPIAPDRKLSFNFKYPLNPQALDIGMPQIDFQLLHCGPYMDRLLDAKPDPRVSSFVPDGWQRKVLDELDADNSVFVVAPTSAGKTFISFYAMEKVLRANNDDVLVYVAPTKALVNQIAAEVQGRFSKKYPMAGKSVWAIHTRDYRVNNSTGCQILVTVPHILQIMLLAPTNAKSWAPRVKRIIFDEIHSIGNAEDGVVWEQLLLLAPCPIIALSATIGNPSEFNNWLNETQKANNTKLTMIQHSTRYSDLRKYLYEPPKTFKFEGLGKSHGVGLGLDGLTGLTYFHPVASLVDKSRGMPDDLSLEPRDCFLLWKAMVKFQTSKYPVSNALDPTKALPACVKKADIFKWEKDLKKVLLQWMAERDSPFDAIVKDLTPTIPHTEKNAGIEEAVVDEVDPEDLQATTLPLLYQLHQRQALPAILFNYDRSGCEDIAETLLKQLKSAEDAWKEGKEWQRKMEGWTQWKELKDKKGAKKPPKASKKKGGDDDEKTSKADQARDEASAETSSYDLFDPEAPQDGFTFADKRRCQPSEIDEYVRQLRWKRIKPELIELIQRGIGVHHSGMNRKYRQCVEMLFRKGFLRVVVATGTLSLGINMPCATVVFSGDSVFLTALNFRQAAGRSGRRGFDLLGNVVFQGITKMRACRLLSSRLPDLTGHFPITTTLVLRLFTLLHDSKNSKYAVDAINSLLSQPRLYMGGQSFKEQVLHHLRFSIEYLRRMSLLGPNGEPVNFTSAISHLYFTENSSFAFHALLKDGYFTKLCADIDTKPEQTMHTMMLVLSHLFGRVSVRETSDAETLEKIKRSPSMVYLPMLPKDAEAVLKKHNETTLGIFSTYVKTFAAQHSHGEETVLPLTGVPVGLPTPPTNGFNGNGNVKSNGSVAPSAVAVTPSFLHTLPTPHARSPFVALSGPGDTFATITDLCTSTRHGIFLESAAIPFLPLPSESRIPLNAYLLDFYIHGGVAPLEAANGIRRSDVWFVLNDFSLVLATIVASLGTYLGLGVKGDEELLDVMGSGDAAENEVDEEFAAVQAPVTNAFAAAPMTAPAVVNRKSKKNVAEDWGDDEDKLDAADQEAEAGGSGRGSVSEDKEYDGLMNVYRAFKKLKTEFDGKFREIWA